ncbi:hypothetical protein F941_01826 [Acinetobacter bouvetii DSM 14964 = CIP 107468]|uniref:Uncharacterized protein n=1 Tax=Acinetobacter bouvetii DSM 14964 = CIP 107468 TaxID=1120925 RepID=N9DPR9_9GAMM|nr:hypothetical protein [Acinetobacter bouvetii]ENV82443.1 hypothetical protein F941_01826 [Acinetobacter bouvetii DSM 14964 = CIP 107468]BCU64559.1 hypothetical protein ACBO_13500 [Acinetobacter bouvetii]
MKYSLALIPFILISHSAQASIAPYDHISSIKVNGIELASPVPASQANALLNKTPTQLKYEYSECTGNTEFSAQTKEKYLKFEIFSEDNPQVKNDQFYKNKNSFSQLGQTKGNIWLEWDQANKITDKIQIGQKTITAQYSFQQFKKDFPKSAKLAENNLPAYVILLPPSVLKSALKTPEDYDLPYIGNLAFTFKNGKLVKFLINQGIAC